MQEVKYEIWTVDKNGELYDKCTCGCSYDITKLADARRFAKEQKREDAEMIKTGFYPTIECKYAIVKTTFEIVETY